MKNKHPKIIRNVCVFNNIHKVLIFESILQNTIDLSRWKDAICGKNRVLILKSSAGIMERKNGKMHVPYI